MSNVTTVKSFLSGKGLSDFAVFGLMGNLQAESGFNPINLENYYERKLGYTDQSYTAAVDNGTYTNFTQDRAGYGLAQWTSSGRKAGLLTHARQTQRSIGDIKMQLEFLWVELNGSYKGVLNGIRNAGSIREASDIVLTRFECPADQSESAKAYRASLGEALYHQFVKAGNDNPYNEPTKNLRLNSKGNDVRWLQVELNKRGYHLVVDGIFGVKTDEAVRAFQADNGLVVDGIVGTATRDKILS